MSPPIKGKIEDLIKLQGIEIEIGTIKRQLGGVKQKLDEFDLKLGSFKEKIEVDLTIIEDNKRKYRSLESDIQTNDSKIEKSREKLKSVKTNKEYQSSLKELDDIKEMTSKIEDEMLQCLESVESIEKDIENKKNEYENLTEITEKEKTIINRESDQDKVRLNQLDQELNEIKKIVDPDLLDKYNMVKGKVGIIVVAFVKGSVCQGCNMNIPPQMYNEMQRFDKLSICPHCQRIIYPVISEEEETD